MGKRRIIAETGAGQHGVATATACALLDLECVVYMGVEDIRRQAPNVQRMELLGASVSPVEAGARTLKEAISEAIRDWVTNVDTHALHHRLGRRPGALPGDRARPAARDRRRGPRPDARARGPPARPRHRLRRRRLERDRHLRRPSSSDEGVELIGVEAGGEGLEPGRHGAPLTVAGRPGVLHGSLSAVLQDEMGQILEAHSISAGLDYPGCGPEHAYLRDTGRARYVAVTDAEALETFRRVTRLEGIIPALETAHALHYALQPADSELDVVCCSGRGDKDLAEVLGQA